MESVKPEETNYHKVYDLIKKRGEICEKELLELAEKRGIFKPKVALFYLKHLHLVVEKSKNGNIFLSCKN